jgi:hypothetical protein
MDTHDVIIVTPGGDVHSHMNRRLHILRVRQQTNVQTRIVNVFLFSHIYIIEFPPPSRMSILARANVHHKIGKLAIQENSSVR